MSHHISENSSTLGSQIASEKCPFQKAVESRDMSALEDSLAEDVLFFTPVTEEAYRGRKNVIQVLSLAAKIFVFKDTFSYTNTLRNKDCLVLMFQANIEGCKIDGIDYFELDEDDRVLVLRVMMRPLPAVEAIFRKAEQIKTQFKLLC